MGNGKGFVQVEVTHVRPNPSGTGESNLSIHIGSVHIDQSAGFVYQLRKGNNGLFENPVCGGIGNHSGGQPVSRFQHTGSKGGNINIAHLITGYSAYFHPSHGCARGIRSVGRSRDQHHISVTFSTCAVIGPNHHQARILS